MGVDISMTFGWGVHLEPNQIDAWLGPDDEYGSFEAMENLIDKYPHLTFAWAGDAWVGKDYGFVVYVRSSVQRFDMGREAQAGVYSALKPKLSVEESGQLFEAVAEVVGNNAVQSRWLITVGVS